ncbi:MAG: efflux transporter outer membrane subunit [Planctomycetota bacterium]|jgi:NodT family efflux transporter outer membrane factor (OMF) lipoprotein
MKTRFCIIRICLFAASVIYLPLFSGCKVGPDYVRPETSVPDQWHEKAVQGLEDGSANLQTWWTVFDDPILEDLIQRSHVDNLDLRIAYARIMEARAFLGVASGEYWPEVDGVGFYSRDRVSENGLQAPPDGSSPDQTDLYGFGVDASWEIDVFGRISRTVETAQALMEASVEDYRDVLVALYSAVAQSYIDLRAVQKRIEYTQSNAILQRGTLELTENRREAGLVPQLDVEQAKLVLSSTEAVIPTFRQVEAEAIHRLGVLLGHPPGALYEELAVTSDVPDVPQQVAVGLPTELLRQRPDIRRAERILAAQTAEIGVATAGLYPAFSLSGTFALEGQDFSDTGDWDSRAWGFGPAMRWNLFDGDRIRNTIKVREAQTEQAMADYELTVLEALEEVENAMVSFEQEKQRLADLYDSVVAAQKSVDLVRELYENGLTDFNNVLDMQRSLTIQQDLLAESQGAVANNLVRIYTSLGGGWSVELIEDIEENDQHNKD